MLGLGYWCYVVDRDLWEGKMFVGCWNISPRLRVKLLARDGSRRWLENGCVGAVWNMR